MADPQRLEPIECQVLETISRVLELAKFHLLAGSTSEEEVRAALIQVTDTLSAIPSWIAEGTGPGFSRYINASLGHIAQAMERLEVDDFPERPENEDPRFDDYPGFEAEG